MTVVPPIPVYHDDVDLGFAANPGHYELTEHVFGVPGQLTYRVSIEKDGSRSTGSSQDKDSKPEIWIFGCSFTWGQGLSDEETYPYLVQQYFPEYRVRNFGENGYGTVQALIQMRRLFAQGKKPAAIAIGHAYWHNQRNIGDPKYVQAMYWFSAFQKSFTHSLVDYVDYKIRKLFLGREVAARIAQFHFPQAYLDSDGKNLKIRSIPMLPEIDEKPDPRINDVTVAIFDQIYEESSKRGLKPIILDLYSGPDTEPFYGYFRQKGFLFEDAHVDSTSAQWNLLPWNSHPNGKANRVYADHLIKALKTVLK